MKFFDGKALGLLSGEVDRYRGIKIEETGVGVGEANQPSVFKTQLANSLD